MRLRGDLRGFTWRLLDHGAYWIDCGWSVIKAAAPPKPGPHLVAVYFHAVLDGPVDGLVDPQEGMTPTFLREFIRRMLAAGYTFVTPDVIHGPDRPAGNLALLSSDDGYRSVERLLPMLEEERAPLTIFVTTEYSRSDAIYWWDQLYMAGRSRSRTMSKLKHHVTSRTERDEALRELALDPRATAFCESHRLLSPADISRLALHPYVCFGNHTKNHLSLPLMEQTAVANEVMSAGQDIEAWTGRSVHHFAFPYGDYDAKTLAILQDLGYRTAFITQPGHFPLPSGLAEQRMHVLPRYRLRADRSAKWQARILCLGITAGSRLQARLISWAKRALHWLPLARTS